LQRTAQRAAADPEPQAAEDTLSLTTTRPRRFVVMNNGAVMAESSSGGLVKLRK
jgi:sulfur carrier protein ThiS